MPQKILICGFPHCGTSILKSIIGHVEDVSEIKQETSVIKRSSVKQFILCKNPFICDKYFSKKYKNYIKIFIIRNPLFVFSSLNKRFEYNIPDDHSFNTYVDTIKKFIEYRNNIKNDVYTIRYEDIFENNFHALKQIIDNIGMKYDDNIFDNTKYTNIICPGVKLVDKKPKNTDHGSYRTWQINQPFVLNNDISKLDLSEIQKQEIIKDSYVLQLYPDINSAYKISNTLPL